LKYRTQDGEIRALACGLNSCGGVVSRRRGGGCRRRYKRDKEEGEEQELKRAVEETKGKRGKAEKEEE
jgi:hypothetical protein